MIDDWLCPENDRWYEHFSIETCKRHIKRKHPKLYFFIHDKSDYFVQLLGDPAMTVDLITFFKTGLVIINNEKFSDEYEILTIQTTIHNTDQEKSEIIIRYAQKEFDSTNKRPVFEMIIYPESAKIYSFYGDDILKIRCNGSIIKQNGYL